MIRKALTVTALTLVAALAPAGGAQAGSTQFVAKAAKEKDGPYKENVRVNVANGQKKSLWFKVTGKQESGQLDLQFVDGESTDSLDGYKVRWFKHGDDVTSEVNGEGYPFHVSPGQSKYFNALVKRTSAAHAPFCLIGGGGDPMSLDTDFGHAGINEACPN